ncbi:hypothetical protein VTP01DRAFT_2975 [Rhizomucor pusillus]|uniref:uncharacterized protein n=1 Tax=Rhizomucor pusillus TaxID=4840 RepID=UPI0037434A8C
MKKRLAPYASRQEKLLRVVGDGRWEVREINDQHNPAMMEDAFGFHQYRKLNEEGLATALKILKAGTKPKQICEALRDTEGKLSVLPKDLDNFRMRTERSNDSVKDRMVYLGAFLDERGYEVSYQYDSEKRLQSIFFAHPASIEKARRFPEVVLVDATYRTNQYHMPYVNVVGISNVGRQKLMSFAIGDYETPPCLEKLWSTLRHYIKTLTKWIDVIGNKALQTLAILLPPQIAKAIESVQQAVVAYKDLFLAK